ncbi:MAG: maleylpyruvate isomerase family mycothiol-dependent enzyme [Acidimicrobiales bacterium]
MALSRHEVAEGFPAELGRFEELLRSLDDGAWQTPSRCEGWRVADVAAHAVGQLADAVAGRLDGLGTPEVTAREVDERRGRSPAELADELAAVTKQATVLLAMFDEAAWSAPSPGTYEGTLGDGIEALWYDTWLHADDIRHAIGRPTVTGDGLRAGVSHVAFELGKRGWGPATLVLEDAGEWHVGADPNGLRRVTADPMAFVLAASGRADPSSLGLGPDVNIYG